MEAVEYYQGRKRAIANIYEAGLTIAIFRLLEQFEVKANLVVPILLEVGGENTGFSALGFTCRPPMLWFPRVGRKSIGFARPTYRANCDRYSTI